MIIRVRVRANSSMQCVEKVTLPGIKDEEAEVYFVKLKSQPEEGKANLELLKLLTQYFGKPVHIKSGFTSKNKIIEVED